MSGNHNLRAHALLSASGAKRWVNCTPSSRLEEKYGEPVKPSVFAEEGTLAHEIGELKLHYLVKKDISAESYEKKYNELVNNKLFSSEMPEEVDKYIDYCIEAYTSRSDISFIAIEQKLDLSDIIPEGFGTADCIIAKDNVLEIVDLKYGKGIPVEAEWNYQLLLYAYGALKNYEAIYKIAYDEESTINTLRLTIVQPRLDNISSWDISKKGLLDTVNEIFRPAAERAFAGEGDINAGDWCRFCRVKNRCLALYEKQIELVKNDFKKKPKLLNDKQISNIVLRAKDFKEWLDSIVEYATCKSIVENKIWPDLKLVPGRATRKWIIPEEEFSKKIYEAFPEISEEDIYSMKLNSLTAIEKKIGKKAFSAKLSPYIAKSSGSPTLVSVDDKREPLNNAISDFK